MKEKLRKALDKFDKDTEKNIEHENFLEMLQLNVRYDEKHMVYVAKCTCLKCKSQISIPVVENSWMLSNVTRHVREIHMKMKNKKKKNRKT